ncbi:MAG: VCBS repeat-containing protein, partial [Flavobacteriia bacterium]|nr:VCBS repeat-containing protein [Flavobacteriia bacterium]
MSSRLLTPTILFLVPFLVFSQQIDFVRANVVAPHADLEMGFNRLENANVVVGDVDGDGDLDIIQNGTTLSGKDTLELVLNDGVGNFTVDTIQSFPAMARGALKLADLDGNGSLDLLISGSIGSTGKGTHIMINDGMGNFILQVPSQNLQYFKSGAELADLDGDGDLDIICTSNSTGQSALRFYENDGTGYFTLVNSQVVVPSSWYHSIAVGDTDNDGDLDLVINGQLPGSTPLTSYYYNDSDWVFTPDTGFPIIPLLNSDLQLSDYDGDGYLDLLTGGVTAAGDDTTVMYVNNGQGLFFADTSVRIVPTTSPTFISIDVDNDSDLDIFLSGAPAFYNKTRLYLNDGSGDFSPSYSVRIEGAVYDTYSASGDFDGDGDVDIYSAGKYSGVAYMNDGVGNFHMVTSSTLVPHYSRVAGIGDLDGDNDLDLITTGITRDFIPCTFIHLNDGYGNFTSIKDSIMLAAQLGNVDIADVDGDGDNDILLTGRLGTVAVSQQQTFSKLYLNDGSAHFIERGTVIYSCGQGLARLFDVDGDSDIDILLSGKDDQFDERTELYLNDGNGLFSTVLNSSFEDFGRGGGVVADLDNDGDLDVILSGKPGSSNLARCYSSQNDGTGTFTPFPGYIHGHGHLNLVGDIDGDGYLDLVTGGHGKVRLYLNDGSGFMVHIVNHPLPFINNVGGSLGDLDMDGDLDLILNGTVSGVVRTMVFVNDGTGSFTEELDHPFESLYGACFQYTNTEGAEVIIADLDGDTDADVIMTGTNAKRRPVVQVYFNQATSLGSESTTIYSEIAEVKLFPNPTQSDITVEMPFEGSKTLRLMDIRGAVLEVIQTDNVSV